MNKFTLPVIVEKDEDGYFASCPFLQGCYTQGDTYEEILENIKDAISLHGSISLTQWVNILRQD